MDQNPPPPPNKKGRIIIRNLIFDIQKSHLQSLCSKFGAIEEINLPINPTNNKAKGFAFVQFANRNHAAKAISTLNGTKFKGRTIVLDFSVDKTHYVLNQKKHAPVEEEVPEEVNSPNLPMKKHSKIAKKQQMEIEEVEVAKDEQEKTKTKTKNNSKQKKDRVSRSLNTDRSDIPAEKQKQKAKSLEKKEPVTRPKEQLDNTVFVRNLPLDLEEPEFKEFFEKFGEIQIAKVPLFSIIFQLVKNKETGDYKGTGFIKFKDQKVASSIIEKSSRLEQLHQEQKFRKKNKQSEELEISGRRIYAFKALERDGISNLKEPKQKIERTLKDIKKVRHLGQLPQFDPSNKRNLNLCSLGIFEPEEGMHENEQKRREDHVREKVERLKNPNFFVSDVRVAFKNLPKGQTNLTEALTELISKILKKEKTIAKIYISREKELAGVDGKEAPQTGLAFVTFKQKEDALNFITTVTRSRDILIQSFKKLPIIEFAIEDARKLKKIQERQEQQKERMKELNPKQPVQEKKSRRSQVTLANKILLNGMIEANDKNEEKLRDLWRGLKSRGTKQRLKKKIEEKFQIQLEQHRNSNPEVQQQKKEVNKEEKGISQKRNQREKSNVQQQEQAILKEIQETVKLKKQQKKKRQEAEMEHDELDELAEKHVQGLSKRVKWYK